MPSIWKTSTCLTRRSAAVVGGVALIVVGLFLALAFRRRKQ
jgi:hypothetical protein